MVDAVGIEIIGLEIVRIMLILLHIILSLLHEGILLCNIYTFYFVLLTGAGPIEIISVVIAVDIIIAILIGIVIQIAIYILVVDIEVFFMTRLKI